MMTVAFVLWAVATVIRVFGPMFLRLDLLFVHAASGVAWTVAYLLLLAFGVPIWLSPRVDAASRSP
jgi:uncharacterized protein involved in response to NO